MYYLTSLMLKYYKLSMTFPFGTFVYGIFECMCILSNVNHDYNFNTNMLLNIRNHYYRN